MSVIGTEKQRVVKVAATRCMFSLGAVMVKMPIAPSVSESAREAVDFTGIGKSNRFVHVTDMTSSK